MFNHILIKLSGIEKIVKWQYQYNVIKVNNGHFHSKHFKILRCIAIDIQSCFMEFYFKAKKSSLAFYLNKFELKSKLDMPFYHIFKYYEKVLKKADFTAVKQICEIAEYCIIDALSYQRLIIKHNIINEYKEIASIAFISLFDVHYFAIRIKV